MTIRKNEAEKNFVAIGRYPKWHPCRDIPIYSREDLESVQNAEMRYNKFITAMETFEIKNKEILEKAGNLRIPILRCVENSIKCELFLLYPSKRADFGLETEGNFWKHRGMTFNRWLLSNKFREECSYGWIGGIIPDELAERLKINYENYKTNS